MCLPWAWISTILPWSKSAPHSKAICFVSQTRTKQDKGRISKLLYSTSTLADTYRSPQSWNKTEFNWHGQWAHQRLKLTPIRIWDLVLCWYPTAVGFESWNEFLYASVTVAMFTLPQCVLRRHGNPIWRPTPKITKLGNIVVGDPSAWIPSHAMFNPSQHTTFPKSWFCWHEADWWRRR